MFQRKTKSTSYLTVIALFVFSFFLSIGKTLAADYTNYYGIEITNDEYDTLLNLGFNEDEIYHMDLVTFNANKDADATLLVREEKFYKTVYPAYGNSYTVEVTEEEYYNSDDSKISLRGEQTTPYKHIVTTISANGSRYRYKISMNWRQIPSVKKYDIIGIGFDDFVHIYNSIVYFSYFYTDTNGTDYSSTQYYDQKVTSYGATSVYKIPENITITGLGAGLYFDVEKDSGVGTLTSLSMCGDYSHATSTSVTASIAANHSIGYGGIGLTSSNINLFDALPCTYASKSVNW